MIYWKTFLKDKIMSENHPITEEQDLALTDPEQILARFKEMGMAASYHFADDTGAEWRRGSALSGRAIRLAKAHPELREQFLEIGKKFLWNLQMILKIEEKREGENGKAD